MRARTLALAGALLTFTSLFAQPATILKPLTLGDALDRAVAAHPALRSRQAQLAAAEGLARDADAPLYNNPQLNGELTRRTAPGAPATEARFREWAGGVSQTIETGGQPRFRHEAAQANLQALRQDIEFTRRQTKAAATSSFYRVLALQERVDVEAQAARLFDEAAAAVQKRRLAGEDTRLDANVARVEAERARNQLALAQEQLLDARTELAAIVQLAPGELPRAQGELSSPLSPPPLEPLLASLPDHPRLLALREHARSANARLRLEKASVSPDVTVGLSTGREGPPGGRERLTTFTVSVPLPLFRRNAAGIGQAASDASQAQIEYEAALRDARTSTIAAWEKLRSQEERVRRLQQAVVPTLDENLSLSQRSRQVGQIGLLEQIVVSRQALDARRDLLDALIEYHATNAALAQGVHIQKP